MQNNSTRIQDAKDLAISSINRKDRLLTGSLYVGALILGLVFGLINNSELN